MRYGNVRQAVFIERPNRFIAIVELDGRRETVHVKNTGRCRELLLPGCEIYLAQADNPKRRTGWDLIAVRKTGGLLVNIDSQAPNAVVREWLESRDYDSIRPEYTYGDSRIDFCLEKGDIKTLMEVKGCTLEIGWIGYFPDAPTERGVKHLNELAKAVKDGYRSVLAFVIQMDGITEVRANTATDPLFGATLDAAVSAGVEIMFLPCHVEPDELLITI